jgi:hypothetical protein
MGLAIGVVNITYLDQPPQPMYRFMQDLMENPDVGLDADDNDSVSPEDESHWGDGWGTDSFYEFFREGLLRRAGGWARQQDINPDAMTTLLNWVENLPYRDDVIMLHLSI